MKLSSREAITGTSLRARVAAFLVLVGLFPLFAVACYVVFYQQDVLSNTANDNLAKHAVLQADAVERIINGAVEDVGVLAANPIIQSRSASAEEKSGQLEQAQDFFDIFEDITLVDHGGVVISSTSYLYYGAWEDKPWFEEAASGRSSISEAHLIPSPSRLVVVITVPVTVEGQVTAVVAGQVNMERVWAILDSVTIGDSGFLVLLDRNENLLSHPNKELLMSNIGGTWSGAVSGNTREIEVPPADGRSQLVGHAAATDILGWQVVALQDQGEADALANGALMNLVAIGVVVLVITFAASLILSRSIARPIGLLASGMRQIAAGRLDERVSASGLKEIEDLSSSFNTMATNLQRSAQDLRRAHDKSQTILNAAGEGIYGIDANGHVTFINPSAQKMLGWTGEDLNGRSAHETLHHAKADGSPYRHADCPILAALQAGNVYSKADDVFWTKDGISFPVEYIASPIQEGETIVGAVVTFQDISERRAAEETIRHLAYHDSLTRLPNRALFTDRVAMALNHARRASQMVAVIFLDLDRFKLVNDTLGHAVGDQLLQDVAEELVRVLRDCDTVARMSGDEFTFLIPDLNRREEALEVGERILDGLRQQRKLGHNEMVISGSLGIAVYPDDGDDPETLLRNADIAMYRAKDNGRDVCQMYDPMMNASIVARVALEQDLRRALKRKEFVLHYQPKVNVDAGEVVGAEALVRWQHPERGLVPPAEFITVAEETGLIVPLGEWVLRAACEQMNAWQDAGLPPIRLSVNLSPRQWQHDSLVEMVAAVIGEVGVNPAYLQLEITESVMMQDVDRAISVMGRLKQLGVEIAVDDFGTGYSSLNYLKRFPIDVLKIDRSFVREMHSDANDAAIVQAIIALARTLKLAVVAEGVETIEQMESLKERQCYEMQGYLFGKPVPAEAFKAILTQNKRPLLLASTTQP